MDVAPVALKTVLKTRGSKVCSKLPTYGADGHDTFKVSYTGQLIQLIPDPVRITKYEPKTENSLMIEWEQRDRKKINRADYDIDGFLVICKEINAEGKEGKEVCRRSIDLGVNSCEIPGLENTKNYIVELHTRMRYKNPQVIDYNGSPFGETYLSFLIDYYTFYFDIIQKGLKYGTKEITMQHCRKMDTKSITFSYT